MGAVAATPHCISVKQVSGGGVRGPPVGGPAKQQNRDTRWG